jgi:hypothetical protein
MSMDKSKLVAYLDNLPLLEDEKAMWKKIGFYIEAVPSKKEQLSSMATASVVVDNYGKEGQVGSIVGKNLRLAIIEWWQGERVKPKSLDVLVEANTLSELENRNG